MILDFGLGERGLFDHRPHHRLGAAIKPAVHHEFADLAEDRGLGMFRHRGVGIGPIADTAEPLELLALHGHPVRRELAAFAPEFEDRHLVLIALLGAVIFLDLPFDRQAVAVPAGNIRRVAAEHRLGAHDDILEDFVERGAEMNIAVGIRRPVVKDEFRPTLGAFALQPP